MSLDNYNKLRVIGKGSYGEVWLVKHKKDRKQYVLKKMDLQNASKRERKAAEQEAKLLSRLKHPNIVSYKDSFETETGFLYIAMGYCEGGDVYNRLKEQKGVALEERQVVEWFVQIAMALQYMHERNILHRDLKTQNIFLTKSKIIKVGDLGIARVLDSSADMASTLIGTPYYMSPELFSNRPYNHKSDVWALGCCVYEMATLKHAFNAKDMNSLVYKILRGKMPNMPKHYSVELVNLIKAMLNHNPDKRPSVNRILRDPYIKKNIAIFLNGTKKRRSSTSSSRPGSGESRHSSQGDAAEAESARSVHPKPVKVLDKVRSPIVEVDLEPLNVGPELEPISEEPTSGEAMGSSGSSSEFKRAAGAQEKPRRSASSVASHASKVEKVEDSKNKQPPARQRFENEAESEPILISVDTGSSMGSAEILQKPKAATPTRKAEPFTRQAHRSSTGNRSPTNERHSPSSRRVISAFEEKPRTPSPKPSHDRDKLKPNRISRDEVDSSTKNAPKEQKIIIEPVRKNRDLVKNQDKKDKNRLSPRSVRRLALDRPKAEQPKPRPLPSRPINSNALPQSAAVPKPSRSREYGHSSSSLRSKDEAGISCDNELPEETPRGLNRSARERRRERKETETPRTARSVDIDRGRRPSYDPPLSAGRKSDDYGYMRRPESDKDLAGKARREAHDVMDGAGLHKSKSSGVLRDKGDSCRQDNEVFEEAHQHQEVSKVTRQPSLAGDSSTSSTDSDEEDEESGSRENAERRWQKEKKRNDREMNNFISLLDTTLHMNKEDEKSDEDNAPADADADDEDEDTIRELPHDRRKINLSGGITYNVKKPSSKNRNSPLVPVMEGDGDASKAGYNKRPMATPSAGPGHSGVGASLTSTGRLWERITLLRKDCIRALGVARLKQAYDILDNYEEDEVQPQLLALLGKEDCDIYAGKIWQLKFCEESAFGLA